MSDRTVDVVVVGAGVCGLLVASELADAGVQVAIVERGARRPHAEQLRTGAHADQGAQPNHEIHPLARPYPWTYVYGVGGSTLAWAGVTPRLAEDDFRLHTAYGVGRDWPLGLEELAPFYEAAELALGVAGPDGPGPPHPLAPVDELIGPHLAPYGPLPQARPSVAIGPRPPCTGWATCELCPSDARYTGLHTLHDRALTSRSGVTLLERTVVSHVLRDGGRATGVEAIGPTGERVRIAAGAVVLAANGLENAGLLLRSQLDGPDVGRWLFDHEHRVLELELDVPAGNGRGATPATGLSRAFAGGPHRAERGDVLVLPVTPGLHIAAALADGMAQGLRGPRLRAHVSDRYEHTLLLDTVGEDLPRQDRYVELSPNRDAHGLPLNRIHYPPDSDYLERSHAFVAADVVRRLEPLGARLVRSRAAAGGAHALGTCRMGEADGVVDPDLRHHEVAGLYVAGGSAFPSYGAAHPTLTIAALAIRLGRHLAAER